MSKLAPASAAHSNPGQPAPAVNTLFTRNTANRGGAISVKGVNTAPSIKNTTFQENTANNGEGGALYCSGGISYIYVEKSTFDRNNSAGREGGAVSLGTWSGDFKDCTFVGNTATQGAAFSIKVGATLGLNGCVILGDVPQTVCYAGILIPAPGQVANIFVNRVNSPTFTDDLFVPYQ